MQELEGAEPGRAAGDVTDHVLFANWQRTLWAMVGIQFVMTMSFSVLTPIMPLLLPDLGVTNRHSILLWAGILTAATPLIAAFASPLWGTLADRKGRKLMLLRSGFAISLFTALMGFAGNVWQFFAWRALMGAFAGFSTNAIALVASQVRCRSGGWATRWAGSAPASSSARWSGR